MASSDYLNCELYLADCDQARLWVVDDDYSGRPALDEALDRRLLKAALDPIRYGSLLFEALFPEDGDDLLAGYRAGLVIARRENKRLRFRLHVAASAPARLHQLYWERLYDPRNRIALACSREIAFSRYLSVAAGPGTAVTARPRLLVVISDPTDLAAYGLPEIGREPARQALAQALCPLGTRLDWELLAPPATVTAIRDRLVAGGFHALYLQAHGVLHPDQAIASLVLEDDKQRAAFIDEDLFSQVFEGERDLRVVTLIACHGATPTAAEPFSGLGPALVRRGIPAVVAMRRAISVAGAARFTEHFYRNLARTGRVDAATNEARLQLHLAAPNGLEWSTPALFMRLAEGCLWAPEGKSAYRREQRRKRWRRSLIAAATGLVVAVAIAYFGYLTRTPTPASVPADPLAARHYSEGLARLRRLDAPGARDLLQAAAEAAPEHAPTHAALAAAWSALGHDDQAAAAAERAMDLAASLPARERLAIEGRFYEIQQQWDQAIEIYGSLFRSSDDVNYGLRLAEVQIRGGQARQALATLDELRRLPPPMADDLRIDLARALAHLELGELGHAVDSAQIAGSKAKAAGAGLVVARVRLMEAQGRSKQGDDVKAISLLDEAQDLFRTAGDKRGVAQTLEAKAIIVWKKGDPGGARRMLEQALTTYREIGAEKSQANVLNTIGNVFVSQGRLADAEKAYHDALAICRVVNAKRLTATVLLNIGAKFHLQGQLTAALEKYQEAQPLFAELGDSTHLAKTQTNIGEIHYLHGNLNEAREMHESALALRREMGDRAGEAYDTFRLGKVFAAKGELFVARDSFQEALAARERMGQRTAAAEIRADLANLALLRGNAEQAEKLARQAAEVLRVEGVMNLTAVAQGVLARALLAQDRLPEAQQACSEARTIAESSEDRRVQLSAAIVAARVGAASGEADKIQAALHELQDVAAEAVADGFLGYELEARLAAAEIAAAAGETAAAARLDALAKEASDRGFGQIARRARARIGSQP